MKNSQKKEVVEMDYDVVGIGFGPSNISFAIAAEEMTPHLSTQFFEMQDRFSWHGNMLFANATMQISFLKDLVTFRNPRSSFSFLSYVHSKGRIADFANLSQFCPSREEFSDYLAWCAMRFDNRVRYGSSGVRIAQLSVHTPGFAISTESATGTFTTTARSLVFAGGLQPSFPTGCTPGRRVLHCSAMLNRFADVPRDAAFSVAVVGGGQSAAEVVEHLYDNYPNSRITAVVSAFGYLPADDSPFVNQIFDPDWVGPFYGAPEDVKDEMLSRHATTNYAAVDINLIRELFKKSYRDKLSGANRLCFRRMTRLLHASENGTKVSVALHDKLTDSTIEMSVDYLVCATGYAPKDIGALLSPDLAGRVLRDSKGRPTFSRTYRLGFDDPQIGPVYCLGMSQHSHGLTSTLLSNMAVRSGEVLEDLHTALSEHILGGLNRAIA